MGTSFDEAKALLNRGDIAFILKADVSQLGQLNRLHPGACFYAALLVEAAFAGGDRGALSAGLKKAVGKNAEKTTEKPTETGGGGEGGGSPGGTVSPGGKAVVLEDIGEGIRWSLYEAALSSPSALIRRMAAEKLIPYLLDQGDAKLASRILRADPKRFPDLEAALSAAARFALGRIGEIKNQYGDRKPVSSWEQALYTAAALPDAGAVKELERYFFTEPPAGDAYRWVLRYAQAMTPPPAAPQVFSAAAGRAALARSSYGEGLRLLRSALKQEEALFFQYPELAAALGRAFQYASGTGEGIKLFETWFKALPPGENAPSLRFLLPFYGGRMARQRGDRDKALELFKLALEAAPDPLQKDACIWYILSLALQKAPQDFLEPLKTYMPRWYSFPYFDDILDRFIQYLAANRHWKTLEELYALFPAESGGTARAQCAYILGRAALTGKLSGLKGEDLLRTVKADSGASLYYRVMASHWLGEGPAVPVPPAAPSQSAEFPHPEEMEFLLGFFQFGAGAYAHPYVAAWQETLSIPELRAVAEAYQQIEYWDESIRLVGAYQSREDYVLNRRDMELAYPQPFKDLIDAYAKDADLPAELLFGLIRTESTFRPKIRSPVGAVGLAQIMPATALDIAGRLSRRGGPGYIQGGRVDLEDPEINIHLGAQYLRYLITVLDQPMLAVLSYNGGITRLRRWWNAAKSQYPPDIFLETLELNETRLYGRRVLAAAAVYGYLYYALPMEAVAAGIYR